MGPLMGEMPDISEENAPPSLSTGSREEWAAQGHLAPPAALGLNSDKGPSQCPFVISQYICFKRQKSAHVTQK